MSFLQSARCCLNALGSRSRSTRAGQLLRPQAQRFILLSLLARSISQRPPSSPSDAPKSESSNPVVPSSPPYSTPPPPSPSTSKPERITFDFKFSSITTPEALSTLLELARSAPPSEVALRPNDEQRQRTVALNVLTKASKMDPEKRAAYFKGVDVGHPPIEGLEQSRRETAKKQIESGLFDREDALSMEVWEEELRVKREAKVEKLMGTTGCSKEKAMGVLMGKERRGPRRQREERSEMRREMKEAEEAGTKGSDVE